MLPVLSRVIMRNSFAVFILLNCALCCYGSDFVFIGSSRGVSPEQEKMRAAANFYGLNLRVVAASRGANDLAIRTAVEQKETIGVAIDAEALPGISESVLIHALNRKAGVAIPLLIVGIGADESTDLLRSWSGGSASGCARFEGSSNAKYVFSRLADVTRQLSSIELPFSRKSGQYLVLNNNGAVQRVESVQVGSRIFPVFVESASGGQDVFLACATSEKSNVGDDQDVASVFLRIAPELMFVKYCAGKRAWHTLHYYANFTIDDPWLREPYGYVDYQGLVGEMERHRFHTTIAFIPWNYDRSQSNVVSLFRSHSDLLSIAIHGNDHDHKEFTDYRSKPLAVQVGDIQQALARMERFQVLTGISYDKVMIFPHSIAPEQTLGALKTYNYLATINSSNVPQGAVRSADLSETLRPATLSFEGFPSISRYAAGVQIPEGFLAINQFLGNPLLFYDHSELFSRGIDAFDSVADEVNKLEPSTEWRSLGEIVKHLYVVKLRDDSDYDVLAFSNNICLENPFGQNSTFYVQKQEAGSQSIESVTVDGRVQPYTLRNNQLSMVVAVPRDGTRCVAIHYANQMQLTSIDVRHDSAVVYLLRMGSDFRDIYLAKSSIGLTVIRFYNKYRLNPAEVVGFLLLFLTVLAYCGRHLWVVVRRRSVSSRARSYSLMN